MIRFAGILFLLVALAVPAAAGEFNRKLNIDDPAPAWQELPTIAGGKHSLTDLKDAEVVVVVFICNECPVARDYEDRIIDFVKKHAGAGSKVGFVAINGCTGADETLEKMVQRAKKRNFNFTYLSDPSQKLGRAYGATVTPEFFVLNKERKIVYMGAMDDNINPDKVKKTYLDKAVEAALKGAKLPKPETAAQGCKIEYKK